MSNQKPKAAKRKYSPPDGFVCETHDAAKDAFLSTSTTIWSRANTKPNRW
jgi:hypothetical protein